MIATLNNSNLWPEARKVSLGTGIVGSSLMHSPKAEGTPKKTRLPKL